MAAFNGTQHLPRAFLIFATPTTEKALPNAAVTVTTPCVYTGESPSFFFYPPPFVPYDNNRKQLVVSFGNNMKIIRQMQNHNMAKMAHSAANPANILGK